MPKLSVKVNSKNQITIPRSVRERFNIKVGDELLVDVQKNLVVVIPKPANYAKHLERIAPEIWKSIDVEKYLNAERNSW